MEISKKDKRESAPRNANKQNRMRQPYIPLEISRMILAKIECKYRIIDCDERLYVKAYNGNANIEFVNGTTYNGKLINGLIHGEGTLKWPNGHSYTGSFVYNKPHGKGKHQFKDGEYEGSFRYGFRHGSGTLRIPSFKYEGEWKKGKMHGKGFIDFFGQTYRGDFYEGTKQGTGEYQYSDGSTYDGQWFQNKRHGKGQIKSKTQIYRGEWLNDHPIGMGSIIWIDEDEANKTRRNRYEGEVVNNIRQGYGALFYYNWSVYVGMWKNNTKDGLGYTLNPEGIFTSCVYKNDRIDRVIFKMQQKQSKMVNGVENPYWSLLNVDHFLNQSQKQAVSIVCLRVNSQLKSWYRTFSSLTNEKYASCMSASDLWTFLKSYKLFDLDAYVNSPARLNRALFKSLRTRVMIDELPTNDLEYTIEKVRKLEDLDELYFIYQAQNTVPTCNTKDKVIIKRVNLHDPTRVVSFRQFVEALIILAHSKANKNDEQIAKTFTEIIERCFRSQTFSRSGNMSINSGSLNHSLRSVKSVLSIIPHKEVDIPQLFTSICSITEQRLASIDKTVKMNDIRQIIRFHTLDQQVKLKFLKYFLRGYETTYDMSEKSIEKLMTVELTQHQFKDFIGKWKDKHAIFEIKKTEKVSEAMVYVRSAKMKQKEYLLKKREVIEKKMLELELQAKKISEEIKSKTVQSQQSLSEIMVGDSFSSLQSDF